MPGSMSVPARTPGCGRVPGDRSALRPSARSAAEWSPGGTIGAEALLVAAARAGEAWAAEALPLTTAGAITPAASALPALPSSRRQLSGVLGRSRRSGDGVGAGDGDLVPWYRQRAG